MYWFTARTTPNYLNRVKQKKTRTISRKKSLKPVRTVAFRAWTKTMTWWPFRTKSTTWKKYKHLFEVMVKWWVSEASLFLRQNFKDILIQLNENVLIRLNFNYSRFMKVDYLLFLTLSKQMSSMSLTCWCLSDLTPMKVVVKGTGRNRPSKKNKPGKK